MRTELRTASVIGCALTAALTLSIAVAHPLGNFSVNYYSRIELAPGAVHLIYVQEWAEVPTFQLKSTLDANSDGKLDADETHAYALQRTATLRHGLVLLVDGTALVPAASEPVWSFAPGQGGLDTLRLTFTLTTPLPTDGGLHHARFTDANDVERLGWREIVVRAGPGIDLRESTAAAVDVSNELRSFPAAMLARPLHMTTAQFAFTTLPNAQPTAAPTPPAAAANGETPDERFAALIRQPAPTPQTIAAALITALLLGALHALEPGHGKSVAAAYLVGARATPQHALLLGATITLTHTGSVFILGAITLAASQIIPPEKIFPYLGLLSAAIVLAMGVQLIISALRRQQAANARDHPHNPKPDHAPPHKSDGHSHSHDHAQDAHNHIPSGDITARNVVAVGISGGLVPCPTALVVLLSAIALGRIAFGLVLITAFSLGLAAVITTISLLLVYARRAALSQPALQCLFDQLPSSSRAAFVLPLLSGMIVLAAGIVLLWRTL